MQCKQLAAAFQARLLDKLIPAKTVKEEPAVRDGQTGETSALNDDTPAWRGTCAICLHRLPLEEGDQQFFYACCCKTICADCYKSRQDDEQCPVCQALFPTSSTGFTEWLCRLQEGADTGNTEAQLQLGDAYRDEKMGLTQSFTRAVQLYERAAAQGYAKAQNLLGSCYQSGDGVEIDLKAAVQWYRRVADQGHHIGQYNLGQMLRQGLGVAQSDEEAVGWYRLAAAQGYEDGLFSLGVCYANGEGGLPQDDDEALRLWNRAAAKGHACAAEYAERFEAD